VIETRIHLVEATRRGVHPARLFGRFAQSELVFVLAGDGRKWTRKQLEACEMFEARIVRDLVEAADAMRQPRAAMAG
jgi:hypothetical protein